MTDISIKINSDSEEDSDSEFEENINAWRQVKDTLSRAEYTAIKDLISDLDNIEKLIDSTDTVERQAVIGMLTDELASLKYQFYAQFQHIPLVNPLKLRVIHILSKLGVVIEADPVEEKDEPYMLESSIILPEFVDSEDLDSEDLEVIEEPVTVKRHTKSSRTSAFMKT
jgi:hypothetical protein